MLRLKASSILKQLVKTYFLYNTQTFKVRGLPTFISSVRVMTALPSVGSTGTSLHHMEEVPDLLDALEQDAHARVQGLAPHPHGGAAVSSMRTPRCLITATMKTSYQSENEVRAR
jgi:hypothetical protein